MSAVTPLTTSLLPSTKLIEEARNTGYIVLSPMQRQIAIEFVVSGRSVSALSKEMGYPSDQIRRVINDPIVRAFISDLQAEVAQHKIINAAWVEAQIINLWPKFTGEEEVDLVGKDGINIKAKKFHATEITSILKHFSGNSDQKKAGGTHVVINFGDMGVSPQKGVTIDVEAEDV